MVLESIIKPSKMERHPAEMLFVGFFYSSLGIGLASMIFGEHTSISSVFVTTLPLILIMINTMKYEEKKDLEIHRERFLIKEHGKALSMFFFLFMGMVVSYSFWFTVVPLERINNLFGFQVGIIQSIQRNVSAVGSFTNPLASLEVILWNNLTVLAFCVIFSLLFGGGAIFILALNASVIGVAVGSRVRDYLASCSYAAHHELIYGYCNSSVSVTFCYMFHGVFEVSAYIIGTLAGGIISVALVNHDFASKEFWHIATDTIDLLVLSVILVVIGSFIEVFGTPLIC